MRKGIISILIIGIIASLGLSGCAWVGRTAGKAQAKIERKANDLEQGYQQGYGDEKRREDAGKERSQPAQSSGESASPAGDAV